MCIWIDSYIYIYIYIYTHIHMCVCVYARLSLALFFSVSPSLSLSLSLSVSLSLSASLFLSLSLSLALSLSLSLSLTLSGTKSIGSSAGRTRSLCPTCRSTSPRTSSCDSDAVAQSGEGSPTGGAVALVPLLLSAIARAAPRKRSY